MIRGTRAPVVFLLAALILAARPAGAAEVEVSPLRFTFGAERRSEVLRIRNHGPGTIVLQIRGFRWTQPEDGPDAYEPTDDVLFFPRIFELEPHAERTVRIGVRVPAGEHERAYRLYVEQLPGPGMLQTVGVRTLLRMGIPLFVSPRRPEPSARIDEPKLTSEAMTFRLRNDGNVHFIARRVRVTGADAAGAVLFREDRDGWYLLPGTTSAFRATLPAAECRRIHRLEVEVETDTEPLRRAFSVDPATCGS